MNLKEKNDIFNKYLENFNFENKDTKIPRIQWIRVEEDTIEVSCEMYFLDLDNYLTCDGGNYKNIEIVNKFNKLNLDNKDSCENFIKDVENLINWKEVTEKLSEIEKECLKYEYTSFMKAQMYQADIVNMTGEMTPEEYYKKHKDELIKPSKIIKNNHERDER